MDIVGRLKRIGDKMAWFCQNCGTQLIYTKELKLYSCPKCDPETRKRIELEEEYDKGYKQGYEDGLHGHG